MSMLTVGVTLELEGKTYEVTHISDEDGICDYTVEVNGVLHYFIAPIPIVDAAWGYAMMQVGR